MSRVFILSSGSIFGRGVEELLDRCDGLDVVGSSANLMESIGRIRQLAPDVLILDKDCWPGELPTLLVGLLEQEAGIKIIGLSLQNNTISSYHKEMREITTVEDLMEVIG